LSLTWDQLGRVVKASIGSTTWNDDAITAEVREQLKKKYEQIRDAEQGANHSVPHAAYPFFPEIDSSGPRG
jgi:hypothetical protein